ncbi:hypothetical protein BC829DRAFT_413790 [Chytridium lagenaria]|nr:hypothetical protein BC829DRAFT_413790 [Chytridium lagenaria]
MVTPMLDWVLRDQRCPSNAWICVVTTLTRSVEICDSLPQCTSIICWNKEVYNTEECLLFSNPVSLRLSEVGWNGIRTQVGWVKSGVTATIDGVPTTIPFPPTSSSSTSSSLSAAEEQQKTPGEEVTDAAAEDKVEEVSSSAAEKQQQTPSHITQDQQPFASPRAQSLMDTAVSVTTADALLSTSSISTTASKSTTESDTVLAGENRPVNIISVLSDRTSSIPTSLFSQTPTASHNPSNSPMALIGSITAVCAFLVAATLTYLMLRSQEYAFDDFKLPIEEPKHSDPEYDLDDVAENDSSLDPCLIFPQNPAPIYDKGKAVRNSAYPPVGQGGSAGKSPSSSKFAAVHLFSGPLQMVWSFYAWGQQ